MARLTTDKHDLSVTVQLHENKRRGARMKRTRSKSLTALDIDLDTVYRTVETALQTVSPNSGAGGKRKG